MAKDKKGNDKKQYPKLVMSASGTKVRVNSQEEEDAVPKPAKAEGWDKITKGKK